MCNMEEIKESYKNIIEKLNETDTGCIIVNNVSIIFEKFSIEEHEKYLSISFTNGCKTTARFTLPKIFTSTILLNNGKLVSIDTTV